MGFGERLRELREKRGLTQEELGKKINQKKANISKYETGKLQPSIETIDFLANYFNVTADYLLDRTDNPQILKTKEPDFSPVFDAPNLGDAIVRIVNICAEFNLSKDVMFEMFNQAVEKYGKPGGVGGKAAHGPSFPGSGVLDDDDDKDGD